MLKDSPLPTLQYFSLSFLLQGCLGKSLILNAPIITLLTLLCLTFTSTHEFVLDQFYDKINVSTILCSHQEKESAQGAEAVTI